MKIWITNSTVYEMIEKDMKDGLEMMPEFSLECSDSFGIFDINAIPEENIITISRGSYPMNEKKYSDGITQALLDWKEDGLIGTRLHYNRVSHKSYRDMMYGLHR